MVTILGVCFQAFSTLPLGGEWLIRKPEVLDPHSLVFMTAFQNHPFNRTAGDPVSRSHAYLACVTRSTVTSATSQITVTVIVV
jgi:hypothetical protein